MIVLRHRLADRLTELIRALTRQHSSSKQNARFAFRTQSDPGNAWKLVDRGTGHDRGFTGGREGSKDGSTRSTDQRTLGTWGPADFGDRSDIGQTAGQGTKRIRQK